MNEASSFPHKAVIFALAHLLEDPYCVFRLLPEHEKCMIVLATPLLFAPPPPVT